MYKKCLQQREGFQKLEAKQYDQIDNTAYLPADSAAKVLHDELVVGPGGRTVLVQPDGLAAAVAVAAAVAAAAAAAAPGRTPAAVAARAPAVAVAPVRGPAGDLN